MNKTLTLKEKLLVLAVKIESAHSVGLSAGNEEEEFVQLKKDTEFEELTWKEWLNLAEEADDSLFN